MRPRGKAKPVQCMKSKQQRALSERPIRGHHRSPDFSMFLFRHERTSNKPPRSPYRSTRSATTENYLVRADSSVHNSDAIYNPPIGHAPDVEQGHPWAASKRGEKQSRLLEQKKREGTRKVARLPDPTGRESPWAMATQEWN
jgi:hypothetical protein